MLLWSIGGSGVAGLHPFDFRSRPRASRRCGQVLRSADIKAHGGDGRGDLRGGSFGRPVFAGVRGENLARSRSWPAAGLSVGERHEAAAAGRGAGEAAAADRARRPKLGRGAGARSWAAAAQSWRDRRSCFWGRCRPAGGRRTFGAIGEASKRVALPAGAELHRNAGAECRGAKLAGVAQNWRRREVGALVEAAVNRARPMIKASSIGAHR